MKSHSSISRLSLFALCLSALFACGQAPPHDHDHDHEGHEDESHEDHEGHDEDVEVGQAAVEGSDASSAAPAEELSERDRFQADLRAKMAARMQQQKDRKENPPEELRDAEGHLVDKFGNHLNPEDEHDHSGKKKPLELTNKPLPTTNEGARLTFDIGTEKHDFGKLLQGMVAEHEFTLHSSGTEDLIIRQVKPTCGCTVAQVYYEGAQGERLAYTYGNPIPAGTTVWVPAKLHTKGKRGHQNTRINITSTDPRGQTQLGLEADIDPFFVVMPSYLNFGQIRKGEEKTLELQISTVKSEALLMTVEPNSIPAGVTVDLQATGALDPEGRSPSWKLKATAGPELVEGNLARTLMVLSDKVIEGGKPNPDGSPAVFQVSVTLSARVVGPFSFNPPYMSMGLVRPGQVLSRSVRLTCHDADFSLAENLPTVSIKGIAPANQPYPDWIHAERFTPRVTAVPGENSVDIELTCQGMPESLSGSFRGTLLIGLTHDEKDEVVIPITGVCRGGVVPVNKAAGG
ncbi:MAG: DUF1573 domain-containing protein [Planctomycetes bacterium]|nr:DUF1573 domain-containing protein [Planctomycetota bacterium]